MTEIAKNRHKFDQFECLELRGKNAVAACCQAHRVIYSFLASVFGFPVFIVDGKGEVS